MRFLSSSFPANVFFVRGRVSFNQVECFVNPKHLKRTSPDKGVRWLYGCCVLGMRFVWTRAVFLTCPPDMLPGLLPEKQRVKRTSAGVQRTVNWIGCLTGVHRTKLTTSGYVQYVYRVFAGYNWTAYIHVHPLGYINLVYFKTVCFKFRSHGLHGHQLLHDLFLLISEAANLLVRLL